MLTSKHLDSQSSCEHSLGRKEEDKVSHSQHTQHPIGTHDLDTVSKEDRLRIADRPCLIGISSSLAKLTLLDRWQQEQQQYNPQLLAVI